MQIGFDYTRKQLWPLKWTNNYNQFGFMPSWSTMKEIYLLQHLMEGDCVEAKLPRLFWWCQRFLRRYIQTRLKKSRRFKICKNLKKSIKISIKIIFQRKDWITQFVQKNFSKKNLLPEFLLFGNWLPWACNRLPMFLNVEFQISRVTTCDKIFSK